MNHHAIALAALAALTSCNAFAGAEARGRTATPRLPAAFAAQAESPPAAAEVSGAWWSELGAPELDGLMAEALSGNYSLDAALERVARATAEAGLAGAGRQPQVNAGLSAGRSRQVFVGLPIPGSTAPLSSTSDSFGLSLNVSWELDLWGRLSSLERAAELQLSASTAEFAAAQLSITGQVAKAYVALVEARAQEIVATHAVEIRARSLELVNNRFAGGLAPRLELEQSKAELSSARALLESRARGRSAATRQVEVLLGRYPSGDLAVGDSLPTPAARPPVGLPAELLSRRPDLFAAELRMRASDARLESTRAELYPRLALTTTAGTATDDLGDLLDGDFSIWSLGGNLVQPIFHGGRMRANIAVADASAAEASALFADSVLRACAEVEIALDGENELARLVEHRSQALTSARAAEGLVDARYRSGLENLLQVLVAQRTRLDAESAWLGARRAWVENRIDLHLALGGGFVAADANTTEPSR